MTKNEQLRIAAIEKLHAAGVAIHPESKTPTVASAIARHHGSTRPGPMSLYDIVRDYVSPVAPARQAVKFKPLKIDPILAMNFSRASQYQKPMMTPNGTGNHNQYTAFMLDNGRTRRFH